MPFVKGQSGNPAGKPKGVLSRTTSLRELLQTVLEKNRDKVLKMLDEMLVNPRDMKWFLELKASLEPKITEGDGVTVSTLIINFKNSDGILSERDRSVLIGSKETVPALEKK